jgi:hypothetical protein
MQEGGSDTHLLQQRIIIEHACRHHTQQVPIAIKASAAGA